MPANDRLGQRTRVAASAAACLVLGLSLIYFQTLARDITWKNDGADGGDFAAASALAGVAHPSGYPTYLLISQAFNRLPVSTLAGRLAALSALSAAGAAVVVAMSVAHSAAGSIKAGWLAGCLAGFAFGVSPLLWSQAVIVEVHGLQTLLTAAILFAILRAAKETPGPRLVRLGGLLLGLALGNHLTIAFLLLPWLAVVGWQHGRVSWRNLLHSLLAMAIGLAVYVYVPVRAAAMTPVNWGNASTADGFWWLVSGQNYRGYVFGLPPELLVTRVQAWAALLMAQFSWPGLLLGLYGLFYGKAHSPWAKPVSVWMLVAYSVFAIGYGTSDSDAYLLPAYVALALWFGWGLVAVLERISPQRAGLRVGVVVALLLLSFFQGARTLPAVDASRDTAAVDFARTVAAQAPPGAMLFTSNDRDTFSLWYIHFALGQRPDLAVIVEPLLQFDWYTDTLRATYPDLNWPATAPPTASDLVRLNPRPWCNTMPDSQPHLQCSPP